MSFRIVCTATGADQMIEGHTKQYALRAATAQARGELRVSVPSQNFSWASDPLETSMSTDMIMGREVNGMFYDQAVQPSAAVPGMPCPGPRLSVFDPSRLGLLGGALGGLAVLAGLALRLRNRGVESERAAINQPDR